MKNLCRLLMSTICLLNSNTILASDITYSFAEIGYADSTSNSSLDVIGVLGSVEVTDKLYIQAAYGYAGGNPSGAFKAFGMGKAFPLSEQTDLTLSATYISYVFDYPYNGETDSALSISFGARKAMSKRFELSPNVSYNSLSKNVSASMDAILTAADILALTTGIGISEGSASYSLGIRVYFNRN